MTNPVESAVCGPYELVPLRAGSLREHEDGTLDVEAECSYLVRLNEGAAPNVLIGALTVPRGGREGSLRFGNFFGLSELGGRRLNVTSNRLSTDAVEEMLDEVSAALASLPFAAATPTMNAYERGRSVAPDALYHAYAYLRDAMRGRRPNDLPSAVERILASPYELLRPDDPRVIPLGQATGVDAPTLTDIHSAPELLARLSPESGLRTHPLTQALKGHLPELVRVHPLAHHTDTPENRFAVAALETFAEVARRFARLARSDARAASAVNAHEATNLADTLQRWRRHRALEHLRPARSLPINSTVLRGRAGYRELLAAYIGLVGRTRLADPSDLRPLLELRDAALIYECWCYFMLTASVSSVLGQQPKLTRMAVTPLGTHLPYGYASVWGHVQALYNVTFSPSPDGRATRSRDSYSVRLRPDISLRTPSGSLHLFDAKLKLGIDAAIAAEDRDDDTEADAGTFKRQDLYKMHAYRDALGADSAWIIYPGTNAEPESYPVPWADDRQEGSFHGVGAIALRPSAPHDGGLAKLVERLIQPASEDFPVLGGEEISGAG